LQNTHGANVELLKAGLLISKTHPYLAASLDYFQVKPEPCIVEIKCWSAIPEELPVDTQAQVVMQLALAADSDVIDWSGSVPKAVVVAGNPDTADVAIYEKEMWSSTLFPKAYMFYLHGVLPKLAPLIRSNDGGIASPSTRPPLLLGDREPQTPVYASSSSSSEEEETPIISPPVKEKKTVFRLKTGTFGVVEEMNEDQSAARITWDGEQRRSKWCSLKHIVVCPKPRQEWVRPTKVGQRVLVCAGERTNLVGKVVSIGVEKCSLEVKDDSGARSVSGVKLEYLHVLHEKPSSESDDGPVFVGKTYTVKVSEVKEWLQNYQLENEVDLVLHKTNETFYSKSIVPLLCFSGNLPSLW
jgi:hypothetical protein